MIFDNYRKFDNEAVIIDRVRGVCVGYWVLDYGRYIFTVAGRTWLGRRILVASWQCTHTVTAGRDGNP